MQQSEYSAKHDPSEPISPVNASFTFDSKNDTRHEDRIHDTSTTSQVSASMASSTNSESPSLPRLSRAFSMPLSSQTSHWQHPGRISFTADNGHTPNGEENTGQHFHDLALELADSVQLAVQTLFQLSPPHMFDPAKEQFSGCSINIPTPSLTALLMSMKHLNYISANIHTLGSPRGESPTGGLRGNTRSESIGKDEFDIAEALQNVGDSFGGIASEAEVDLVLHHGDALKHMGVRGDECGISYALSHIVHQVLATARPGDSIEIGLSIVGQPSDSNETLGTFENESPIIDSTGPIVCTFDIAHKFSSFVPSLAIDTAPDEDTTEYITHGDLETVPLWRPEPQFDSIILRRLLIHIGGTLRPSLEPHSFPNGRRCELSISLELGPSLLKLHQRSSEVDEDVYRDLSADFSLAKEPAIDELLHFADTLKGKKVTFHASSSSSFAHHLTRYLTAWGMDISHVPTDGTEERNSYEDVEAASGRDVPADAPGGDNIPPIIDSISDAASDKVPLADINPTFVIIDDDILTLRRRLLQYRAEVVPNIPLHARKRPSLAVHHRPRSTPSIRNARLASGNPHPSSISPFTPVPIVHFTSLGKYKLVKDVIQANILSPVAPQFLPELIVIPKPAGPRRILTSLYTAIRKPVVDPFFSPIATSPMSPSGYLASFISNRKPPSVLSHQATVRVAPDRPSRTNSESMTLPSTSPLSIPEGLEYFSEASGNAASGVVIQSPDGRPAGIFFQPQSRTSSSRSDPSGAAHSSGTLRPPFQNRSRVSSYQAMRLEGGGDRTDSGDDGIKLGASIKPSPANPKEIVLSSSQSATPSERRGLSRSDRSSNKGKGRMGAPEMQHEENFFPMIEWREATQMLANPAVVTVPSLVSTPFTSGVRSAAHSPPADQTQSPPSLTRQTSSQTVSSPHSPTSPSGSDAKRPAPRRATVGSRSLLGSVYNKKTTKTVGSNIVPPINVLLVEDNPINQTMVSIFMKRNKIKYEVAWNGKEAVEKWKKGHFHIILMDIQMPVMDGIAATKEIRRLEKMENIHHFPPTPGDTAGRSGGTPDSQGSTNTSTAPRSQVIIVALTASARQSDRVAALAAGCNDFLTKPVMNSWLADKIIEWGSIKALQMWAELRPAMEDTISHEQAAQAQAVAVAEKLYVPSTSSRRSPSRPPDTPLKDGNAERAEEYQLHKPNREELGASRSDNNSPDSSPDDQGDHVPTGELPTIISPPTSSSAPSRETKDAPIPLCDKAKQLFEGGSLQSVDHLDIPASPTEEPVVDDSVDMVERTNDRPEPNEVTGKVAFLQYLEETKEQDTYVQPPTLLGQRGMEAIGSSRSIASVLHPADADVSLPEPNSEANPEPPPLTGEDSR